ncbi:hypothetical protein AB6A40_005877 [Gnathostoma spinigerum]|uniref:Peptidase M1 leukotriene A4 hydrolase/aminopeptidase C-terminal domain-containing protein n=1 Tax=Gnathostoma spinigerum TaxID=75299 RepID=A0ABD6EQ90_9BILA
MLGWEFCLSGMNFESFWLIYHRLNEGFTVFLERKILGRLEGEMMRQFDAQTGWEDHLIPTVHGRFSENHPFTSLIPKLQGKDPNDAFSQIPYEKGSAFLMFLEQKLNDSDEFEKFMRAYIEKFAYKSVVTDVWKDFLYDYFKDKKAVLDGIDWDNWLYATGMPKSKPVFDDSLLQQSKLLAQKWIDAYDTELNSFTADEFMSLRPRQQMKVLDCILQAPPFSKKKVEKLGVVYNLEKVNNCELRFSWIQIGLKAQWKPIIQTALNFVSAQGRLKYVRPIYKNLFAWNETCEVAKALLEKNAPLMHPLTVSVLRKLLSEPE